MHLVSTFLFLNIVGFYRDRSRTASRMKPWQGYVHSSVVALSVWFCRETIFEALQWWNGRSPSDGLLLGFCLLLTGLACIPIVALHFSHVLVCLTILFRFFLIFIWTCKKSRGKGYSICIANFRVVAFFITNLKSSLGDVMSIMYVLFMHV